MRVYILVLAAAWTVVGADEAPASYGGGYHEAANYAYQYAVKDDYAGLDFRAGKSFEVHLSKC